MAILKVQSSKSERMTLLTLSRKIRLPHNKGIHLIIKADEINYEQLNGTDSLYILYTN